MHIRSLPARPSLEYLKNQAKYLLKSYRARHPAALMRFRRALPRVSDAPDDHLSRLFFSLRDAQQVIAAEHGFESWTDLRTHIQRKENMDMIEVTTDRIFSNPVSDERVIVLNAKGVDRCLPIWIGSAEADSIALKLEGQEIPRPMTHDLMDSLVSDLGAKVTQVIVTDVKDDMFIAKVVLQRNDTTIERDSRPSDAIALAVRCDAPIFAMENVLERAGVAFDPNSGEPDFEDARWPRFSIRKHSNMLSEGAKAVLTQTVDEAKRLGRVSVEPEDILLALVRQADCLGAMVLSDLGGDPQAIRSRLEGLRPSLHAHPSRMSAEQRVPRKRDLLEHEDHNLPAELSEASHRILRLARTEADLFFHDTVDTTHILLGLVLAGDGLAWQVLKDAEIEIEGARAAMIKATS